LNKTPSGKPGAVQFHNQGTVIKVYRVIIFAEQIPHTGSTGRLIGFYADKAY
jgi:hypothetical protein